MNYLRFKLTLPLFSLIFSGLVFGVPEGAITTLTVQSNDIEKYVIANPFEMDGEYADQVRGMGAVYISNKGFFYDGGYHFTDRKTGKFLTFDGRHLNSFGAEKFGVYLRENYPLQ